MRTKRKGKEILVIVHDAGGAEIIAAYIRAHPNVVYHSYVAGPAKGVFDRLRIRSKPVHENRSEIAGIMRKHGDVAFALLGAPSVWMTDIELFALFEAKKAGLKTVVYLEWWKDYRGMFDYPKSGWQKNLPDELWTGDRFALSLAKKQFPHSRIRYVRNEYFADVRRRYRSEKKLAPQNRLLFMSSIYPGMERVFASVLKHMEGKKIRVRLRLHPGDKRNRYEPVIEKSTVPVELSNDDIARDLARSKIVFGTETVALAVSALCDIPTFNLIPKSKKSNLPIPAIKRVDVTQEGIRKAFAELSL